MLAKEGIWLGDSKGAVFIPSDKSMPEATAEYFTELCNEYMKDLVEFVAILEKTQDKVCSICPTRKVCKEKKSTKKNRDRIIQTRNIPKLTALVGSFANHVSKEIFLNITLAMLKKEKAPDRGHKINID